jgi:PAS domain S-box-containing protein
MTAIAREPTKWLEFLSEASKRLSSSLCYVSTLDSLARLTVPTLADWCDIQMLDGDGVLQRVSMIHKDPALVARAEETHGRFSYEAHYDGGMPRPLVENKPQLIRHVTDEMLAACARGPDDLATMRMFAPKSMMLLPLVARQRALGLMVLASADAQRIYDDDDLTLAAELAARAALAVDNARLYAAEQQARADAEAALRARTESERHLHAILEHSPALISVADRDGKLVLVNREYARRVGHSAAELRGRTFEELGVIPPEHAQALRAIDRQVIEERRALQFERTYPGNDGVRTFFTLKFPIVDDAGEVHSVGGISTEVTERKQAEEALRRSQERFEKVFRASTIAICVTSLVDGRFVDGNASLVALTGYSIAEMRGRTGDELNLWVHPPPNSQAGSDRTALFEALRTNGSVSNLEVPMRDRAGRIHDTIMSLELIDLDGQPCILSLIHEVTELKRLNDRLGRVQKMEALGRLAGGIAHDFNNILTAILGYTALVLDTMPPDSDNRTRVGHIERAATRAAALTQQLLVFGRQRVQRPEVIDLNGTVRNLLPMLQRLIDEDVRFETTFAADAGTIEIDPAQLEQVVLNLTLNARDAMPKGGRLRISTSRASRDDGSPLARLTVEDDGLGMDEATRARIFEPFFTTKEVGSGTGLGLATVYGIVEQAGGHILVESQPERGARFDVLLPRAECVPTAAPLPRDIVMKRGRGETLLVVEDDESVCEFVSFVLRAAGYSILTARDGEDAVRVAAAHPGTIELLLTDIVMPHRNGRSLANELRVANPRLRVMYMSGYPGDTIQRYESIPPEDSFLQKPFTREVLSEKVAEALLARRDGK